MIGQLKITAAYKNNKTFLRESYFTHPFKLANITEDKSGSLLKLMIMSSSPGMLNNDQYEVQIHVEENASVHITTQAYQRLFQMKDGASQSTNVFVANGASLTYLPHPIVPHGLCNYVSVANIYLQKQHYLIWSEIITCGRKLNGEEFAFSKYQNVTNVFIEDKLVVKENIIMEPKAYNLYSTGLLEGYTHQSTLLWLNNLAEVGSAVDACREYLSTISGVLAGVTKLPANGLLVRMLGYKGEQLFDVNNHLKAIIDSFKIEPTPAKILLS